MNAPIASRRLDYPHRVAGHCGSGSIRDLLEFHRLDYGAGPLSEGACFGLGGGLGFFSLELPEMAAPVYLVGRTGEFEEDVTTNLGASLEVRETDDPAVGWQTVRNEVDAGRPPMLWADIAELEYLRVRMSNTRHDIVVVGYDEEEGIAFVADNDRDEIQRCSLDSLARARRSHGFPGPNRHRVYVYRWPERLRDPRKATRLALRRAVHNMRQNRIELLGMVAAGGVQGIATFAERYRTWPERFGGRTDAALGALRVLIVKAGTGGALFRSLHAEFLRDMGALLDDAALRSAADVYDELAQAWIELADHAGERHHGDGIATTHRIVELERHGVEAMERCAG